MICLKCGINQISIVHLFYGFLPPKSKCRVSFVGQFAKKTVDCIELVLHVHVPKVHPCKLEKKLTLDSIQTLSEGVHVPKGVNDKI